MKANTSTKQGHGWERERGCRMKPNPNSGEHGKAVAAALLHELEQIGGDYDGKATLDQQPGIKLFARYLEAYRAASPKARDGFITVMGDYVGVVAGGCTPDAASYRKPKIGFPCIKVKGAPSLRECQAHARVWLKGGAR